MKTQFRNAELSVQTREEKPFVMMSISSESPVLTLVKANSAGIPAKYKRNDDGMVAAYEILSHEPGAIDLSRAKDGLVVLDNHKGDQIGLIYPDIRDGKLAGPVTFCNGARAQEVARDAEAGLRRNVSVGYAVTSYVYEGEREGIPVVRATKWTPHEASFVPVPADINVGVNRADNSEIITPDNPVKTKTRSIKMSDENKNIVAADVVEIYRLARAHNIEPGAADEHIKSGKTVDEFRSIALKKAETDRIEMERKLSEAKERKPEAQSIETKKPIFTDSEKAVIAKRYNIMNVVRQLSGIKSETGFEKEVSDEIAKRSGRPAQGFYIPHDAPVMQGRAAPFLKTGNGSNFVATELLTGQFIDALRSNMVLADAGVTMLSGLTGDIAIPKGGTITGGWVDGENGAGTEGKPTVSQITGTPKTASGWTDISRRLLLQSSIDVQSFVQNELIQTVARLIEVAAFAGTNANGQPKGLISQVGVNNPTVTANAPTRAQMLEFLSDIEADNASFANQSWIMRATGMALLANRLESVTIKNVAGAENVGGGPVPGYLLDIATRTMLGSPVRVTNNVPNHSIFFGAWSQLVIGLWSGVDLTVDPYTNSTTGAVRVVALQDADIMVRNGQAFSYNAALTA